MNSMYKVSKYAELPLYAAGGLAVLNQAFKVDSMEKNNLNYAWFTAAGSCFARDPVLNASVLQFRSSIANDVHEVESVHRSYTPAMSCFARNVVEKPISSTMYLRSSMSFRDALKFIPMTRKTCDVVYCGDEHSPQSPVTACDYGSEDGSDNERLASSIAEAVNENERRRRAAEFPYIKPNSLLDNNDKSIAETCLGLIEKN